MSRTFTAGVAFATLEGKRPRQELEDLVELAKPLVALTDDVTVTVANDKLKVKDGGIDTAQLAAEAVTQAKLDPSIDGFSLFPAVTLSNGMFSQAAGGKAWDTLPADLSAAFDGNNSTSVTLVPGDTSTGFKSTLVLDLGSVKRGFLRVKFSMTMSTAGGDLSFGAECGYSDIGLSYAGLGNSLPSLGGAQVRLDTGVSGYGTINVERIVGIVGSFYGRYLCFHGQRGVGQTGNIKLYEIKVNAVAE